ncbi:MAG: zeta toxin family protein [Deltaproteobacteria bacterium]
MKRKKPVCFIIAGPNGAGKTTFAREFLPREAECPVFVNADLIAEGISPFAPGAADIRAGRLMVEEIASHVRGRESFAFETTLSGRRYAALIPGWQKIGYEVVLIFLCLPKVELAIERVRERVRQGGHDVPEEVIRRRYEAGWRNFNLVYKRLVDHWFLYDNAGRVPVLLEKGTRI